MRIASIKCVEMKHRGADLLRKKIGGMKLEEELAFWREQTDALKKQQQSTRNGSKGQGPFSGQNSRT